MSAKLPENIWNFEQDQGKIYPRGGRRPAFRAAGGRTAPPAAAAPSAAQDSTSIRRSAAASSDTAAAPNASAAPRGGELPPTRSDRSLRRRGRSGSRQPRPGPAGRRGDRHHRRGSRGGFLDDIITGRNRDFARIRVQRNVVHIYNEGDVTYQSEQPEADYMRIDMDSKRSMPTARPIRWRAGPRPRTPCSRRAAPPYTMDTITYNIDTKKAKIKGVATQEGDGWLIGGSVKKMADNTINIQDGRSTPPATTRTTPLLSGDDQSQRSYRAKRSSRARPTWSWRTCRSTSWAFPRVSFRSTRPQVGLLMPTYGEEYTKGFFLSRPGLLLHLRRQGRPGATRRHLHPRLVGGEGRIELREALQMQQRQPQFRLLQRARGRKGEPTTSSRTTSC